MKLGMIGLGKMGLNMTTRLINGGHEIVAYDLDPDAVKEAEGKGATGASSPVDLVGKLASPRAVWVMVPAGKPTEETIDTLAGLLKAGDIIIDGGNSYYKDTLRRAETLDAQGIHFMDVGTSGGVWGVTEGYGMMVGGDDEIVAHVSPILETLAPAPDKGWGHVGRTGAGHFVKMVHNGIEYGMMRAYAEGFEILKAKQTFNLDLHQVAEIWRYGTVIRSWLLDLAARALDGDPELADIAPWVADSGEGRWTVFEAVDLNVPAPVISQALMMRLASRDAGDFSSRMVAALRHQFGGHAVKEVGGSDE